MPARRTGKRLVKSWAPSTWDNVDVSGTTQVALAFVAAGDRDVTILRSRGLMILMGEPSAFADTDVIGLGLVVVQANAVAAGGAALPGPIADAEADWLWHTFVGFDAGGVEAAAQPFGASTREIIIDSKAMRRLPRDSQLVLMGEATSGDYTLITSTGGMRILLGF